MALSQKFLFLFKSKYRRKLGGLLLLELEVAVIFLILNVYLGKNVKGGDCGESPEQFVCHNDAECVKNSCVCQPGWFGPLCQFCSGKIRLKESEGWISDGIGNYTANMKCTWLIESPTQVKLQNGSTQPTPIFIYLNEFATECGWDHLYIYDGDSVYSPLLGIFSGLLVQKNYKVFQLPELVARSGYALLHFYTDVAYNLTGFNITYKTQSCPSQNSLECSGNGACLDGICTCNALYFGEACSLEKCPNNCSNHGRCNMEKRNCECDEGFKGHDCSQVSHLGFWEVITPESSLPKGSASHAALVHNNSLWVFGGASLNPTYKKNYVSRFQFKLSKWENIHFKDEESIPRVYGHSCVIFENKVYMYGGVHERNLGTRYVSNSFISFDLITRTWSEVTVKTGNCKRNICGPIHLSGHASVLVSEKGNKSRHTKMIVLFGHSPRYGYVNLIQEYHFGSGSWQVFGTKGETISGSYGHSATWDPNTQKIYVFGGYRIGTDSAYLSDALYSYEPVTRNWHLLASSPTGKFLHGAIVNKGLLMIIGGNGHNDTAYSQGSKCFTNDVLVYDIECNSWSRFEPPSEFPSDLARYGHSVTSLDGSVIIYGGFNGLILNDLIRFTPPICDELGYGRNESICLDGRNLGAKCVWSRNAFKCEGPQEKIKGNEVVTTSCPAFINVVDTGKKEFADVAACEKFKVCTSCVENQFDCVWCGNQCFHSKCKDLRNKPVSSVEQCKGKENICDTLHSNCYLCSSEPSCMWSKDDHCVKLIPGNGSSEVDLSNPCESSCAEHHSCTNCTSTGSCMWCNNLKSCIDKNSYVISFPYGQCMSWSQSSNLCISQDPNASTVSFCESVVSCDKCLSIPSCGWCDGGSGTGIGRCLEGSSRFPLSLNNTQVLPNKKGCNAKFWHFTTCPACQCNGHSRCNEQNECISCEGFTEGKHCNRCTPGYFGSPLNGGSCKPCECNNQAELCDPESGRCFCTTKGIVGDHCERCDTSNAYNGDSTNGGSCFYDLQIDYQFTFNLSKKEDRHLKQINFRNVPTKTEFDAEFHIHCSVYAKMNISMRTGNEGEKFLLNGHNCSSFRYKFSKADFNLGTDNTTFYVYVYELRPPLAIQISFQQTPKLDLLHFFITFSTCFLLLLLVAAVLWKIKQKYDMYRRRQRLFVEMEQMASRPFSQIYLEVGDFVPRSSEDSGRKCRNEWPGPIALEPLYGNRTAVLSLLISLPTGCDPFAPPGQSAIAVGSCLVLLGSPRKLSFEPIAKSESKSSKLRKSLPSNSLNTCI